MPHAPVTPVASCARRRQALACLHARAARTHRHTGYLPNATPPSPSPACAGFFHDQLIPGGFPLGCPSLVVLDEVHNAAGGHAYARVLAALQAAWGADGGRSSSPRLLGLTASPGRKAADVEALRALLRGPDGPAQVVVPQACAGELRRHTVTAATELRLAEPTHGEQAFGAACSGALAGLAAAVVGALQSSGHLRQAVERAPPPVPDRHALRLAEAGRLAPDSFGLLATGPADRAGQVLARLDALLQNISALASLQRQVAAAGAGAPGAAAADAAAACLGCLFSMAKALQGMATVPLAATAACICDDAQQLLQGLDAPGQPLGPAETRALRYAAQQLQVQVTAAASQHQEQPAAWAAATGTQLAGAAPAAAAAVPSCRARVLLDVLSSKVAAARATNPWKLRVLVFARTREAARYLHSLLCAVPEVSHAPGAVRWIARRGRPAVVHLACAWL